MAFFACVSAALWFGSSVSSQDLRDIRNLQYSDWNTVYDAPGGRKVKASVHLRGGTGYYILSESGAQGILSDITYYDAFEHGQVLNIKLPSPPTPAIAGIFNLYGATGFFVFRAPDASGKMDGYSGSWVRHNRGTALCFGGSWDGDLVKNANLDPQLETPSLQFDPKVIDQIAPMQPSRDEQLRSDLEDIRKTVNLQEDKIRTAALQVAALRGALEQLPTGNSQEVMPSLPAEYTDLPPLPKDLELASGHEVLLSDEYKFKWNTVCLYVCRFVAKNDFVHPILGRLSRGSGFGTGILVGPSVVLTCNHVVPTEEVAKFAAMQFSSGTSKVEFDAASSAIVRSSPRGKLDYSLLRLAVEDREPPGAIFNHYYLDTSAMHRNQLIFKNLAVNLIHYPRGQENQAFEIRGLTLKLQSDNEVVYKASTEKGSSGAPVFNDNWWLIAIHAEELADVENKTSYGKGILITSIIDDIRKNPDQQLLNDLRIKLD